MNPSNPLATAWVTRLAVALALMVLCSALLPALASGSSLQYEAVIPADRESVMARTDRTVSAYTFDLRLDPSTQTISGTGRVDFNNQTSEVQSAIPFRLYPNADYYGPGTLEIVRARVEGLLVQPEFTAQNTVMTIPLSNPLKPGEHVEIAFRFSVTVPIDSSGTFGIFSFDAERGTWILADWYPILAGWEPGTGWVLDEPTPAGDPTFSDIATYDLDLTVPSDLTVAATGIEKPGRDHAGLTNWKITTGPVREFTMVIDDDFKTSTRMVGDTEITMYTDGNGSAAAGGELALDAAAEALAIYSDSFGTYPYIELDLVETEMAGALGVSWTGLVFLNGAQFLSNSLFVDDDPARLRFTVVHEVGHQWWGALVGINSNDHTFLLEGLTNYLAVYVTERIEGVEAAQQQLMVQSVRPYLRALADSGDGIPDVSINEPSAGGPSRGTLVYGKAALGFLAIRQEMGDEAFFAAITDWASEFEFAIAGPEDLLAAFEETSGTQLDDLWTFWFESAITTEADVLALID